MKLLRIVSKKYINYASHKNHPQLTLIQNS